MMRQLFRRWLLLVLCAGLWAGAALPAAAAGDKPDPLAVTFDQNLDAPLPLQAQFVDETGQAVTLGDYFGQKPAILVMGYYECPTLCVNVVYPELAKSVQAMNRLKVGDDFTVLAVSIDPTETVDEAAHVKTTFFGDVAYPGWHFLTGDKTAIDAVARAIGYHYAYDPEQDQYAHPTGIVVATPDGTVSRYFFGLEFPPLDLRLSLLEAGKGTVGTPTDQLLLLCYHYDPDNGRYTNVVFAAARLLGLGTMVVLGAVVWRAAKGTER